VSLPARPTCATSPRSRQMPRACAPRPRRALLAAAPVCRSAA